MGGGQLQRASTNKPAKGFCFLKLTFTRAVWIETWRRGRSFLLWHIYEKWRKNTHTHSQTKQNKKLCQTVNIHRCQESRQFLGSFILTVLTCSFFIFMGSRATREEPTIKWLKDWCHHIVVAQFRRWRKLIIHLSSAAIGNLGYRHFLSSSVCISVNQIKELAGFTHRINTTPRCVIFAFFCPSCRNWWGSI